MSQRLKKIFAHAAKKNRSALVTFVMGGDPNIDTSENILSTLANSGADIIEIGMPFSDPMADGPAIQQAGLRALKTGANLELILESVKKFRTKNSGTGIVLMGYYNPVYSYGPEKFLEDAEKAGVDGILLVDLPWEENKEFSAAAKKLGISLIKLVAPTTGEERMKHIIKRASGFIYYVSIAGITGTHSANIEEVKKSVDNLKTLTKLPVAVGFGIRVPEIAHLFADFSDGVVVGSALVDLVANNLDDKEKTLKSLESLVRNLSSAMQR